MRDEAKKQHIVTNETTCKGGFFVRVAVPRKIPIMLDYRWGATTPPVVGQLVKAPVGKNVLDGVVMEVMNHSPFQNLKTTTNIEDVPPLAPETVRFYRWIARYTLSAPGDPIKAALPKGKVPPFPKVPIYYRLNPLWEGRITPQRQKIIDVIKDKSLLIKDLTLKAKVSTAIIKKMADIGALTPAPTVAEEETLPMARLATLTEFQQQASDKIRRLLGAFNPMLLDGVTGSGKTEVYFDSIADILANDSTAQILVLVPEITLTPQWLQRFKERFGFTPYLWHTHIKNSQRHNTWWQVHRGSSKVVVGARSALFLPFRNLKFIVVDEEHDPSYKQSEQFFYHGRDMAVALAHHWKCPVVMASATPSLETWQNVKEKKYTVSCLPHRHGQQPMPPIKLINLTKEKLEKDRFLAPSLLNEVKNAVSRGEQALLFLNRRGNAPVLICTECGRQRGCESCSATLTVHGDKLLCHHCGFTEPWPDACPQCIKNGGETEKSWRPYGPGTRRLMQEMQECIPEARLALADSDAIDSPLKQKELIESIQRHEVDVIIGTQMMAKGHHLPNLTVVGVIDGDMGLSQGDVRAAEKTFQLLTQVAGRAGRGSKKGCVYIQTHQPEHTLFQTLKAYDRESFYSQEMDLRKEWQDPPFGRLY